MERNSKLLAQTKEIRTMVNYTGVFVSWEKSYLLINTIQEILFRKYHTVAKIGPRLANNTGEIILYTQQTSDADISGAKHLVESYLKMIGESKQNDGIAKKVEVIELDVDEDVSCIVLDDSVNETESGASGGNNPTAIKNSSSQIIGIDLHYQNKGSSVPQLMNESNSHRGLKRKNPFKDEEDVVEIEDDDVIVLDDSFPNPNITFPKDINKENSNDVSSVNVVDLTEIDSRPVCLTQSKIFSHISGSDININKSPQRTASELSTDNQILIPRSTSKLYSLVSDIKTTANKVSDFLATTSNTLTVTKTNTASECVSNACNSTTLIASSTHSKTANKPSRGSSRKKESKLAYNRPAHLVVPLTVTSSNAKIDSQSNIYNPNAGLSEKKTGFRPIVIDGNNVAIGHGKGQFSLKGIEICINYFEKRGHRQIKAFIPHYRTNRDTYDGLRKLERQGTVVLTPSRKVDGKVVASYDDRYIVQYATEVGGVIVSTDNFRDLMQENPSWKETIERRLLMFTWVDDLLMFPQDPLGRNGPSLDELLSFSES